MKRILLLLIAALLAAPATTFAADRYRSVIIILMDSLRADHLQTYGYGRATAPNIAAFAKQATVFANAYPAGAWTRPSITALLTGRYSSELMTNIGGSAPIKTGQPTLAGTLKSWGYTTAAFYNTPQLTKELSNAQQGFDTYVDYGEGGTKDTVYAFVPRGVDHVIDFLGSTSKPVFLFLHVLDPHHPYLPHQNHFGKTPTDKYRDSYSFATAPPKYDPKEVHPCYLAKDLRQIPGMEELYDSEIRELDVEVGRLLHYIDATPRYRDALVIITSDHGEEFGEHGGLFHGARFYEESLHVPLIIRDRTRPYSIGRRVDSIVSLVDVAPTILQSSGIPYENTDYSGQSLTPYFTRRGGVPRDLAIIERPGCGYDPIVAVRKGKWKMILRLTRPKIELYDLAADPHEKRDLAADRSPAARAASKELSGIFQAWYRRVNRPLATRNGDTTTAEVPPELRERLKSLGYLQ